MIAHGTGQVSNDVHIQRCRCLVFQGKCNQGGVAGGLLGRVARELYLVGVLIVELIVLASYEEERRERKEEKEGSCCYLVDISFHDFHFFS